MKDTLEILHPEREIRIQGELVTVREMPWPKAIGFLRELSKQAGQFVTSDGRLQVAVERLPEVVAGSEILVDYLLTHSAGLGSDKVATMTTHEVLAVLEAAIELNVSPELFARGKAVAAHLKTVFGGAATKPLTNPSPSNATT